MSDKLRLWIANDNVLRLEGLRNLAEEGRPFLVGAAVTVTLKDSEGTDVSGPVTWPLALADQGGGDYQATLPNTIALASAAYTGIVDVLGQAGEVAHWEAEIYGRTRKA